MRIIAKLIFAALVMTPSNAAAQNERVPAGAKQVRDFYGVPLDLKLWDLKKLSYASELGWEMGEGEVYPTAKIVVSDVIKLDASFDSSGELYMLETSSPGAVGPRDISVGSTLAEVKKAWPSGKLYWGLNHGDYGDYYVTFSTEAGLYYQFSPAALPAEAWAHSSKDYEADPSIKVIAIRLAGLDKEK